MNLRTYLKPHYLKMSLGLSIKFIGTLMDLLIPWILAFTIDSVIPTKSVEKILLWGGAMLLCSVIGVLGNITANRIASKVSRDTIETIRNDLYDKISHLSSKQIDTVSLPSLISRLTSDSYHVHHMIGMMQRLGVRAPILLIGGLAVTLMMDSTLAMVLIALLPFIGYFVYKISKRGIPLYQSLQSKIDGLVRVIRENIVGVRVIKALSKFDYENNRFQNINDNTVRAEKKVGFTMALTNPLMNLMLNLGLTLVVLVGAYRVNSGYTSPGTIIAFLTYFTLILNAMLSISRIFILYSKGFASFDRIRSILELPEDLAVEPRKSIETQSHIVFQDVEFAYNQTTPAVSKINFALNQGETLGIIGPTGSGKSSIIKLLMRFYDPDYGNIYIQGKNIRSIEKHNLHTKFGVTLQNDTLFADTIRENIAFGRTMTDNEIHVSAKLAQAGEFIDTLTDGLLHALDVKGANLSGGQKQRLLISRALAKKPEILILDDATSALDYKTDARLRQAIGNHFTETTTVIIAQRVSSIMHADKILVLDSGQVIGYGTHDQLLASCESYKEIAAVQLGGSM